MIVKLKKLPDVKGKDLDESNDVCLVCFTKIENGKLIGCGHAYHYSCIKTWIEKNANKECPKCRRKINLGEKISKQSLIKEKKEPQSEDVLYDKLVKVNFLNETNYKNWLHLGDENRYLRDKRKQE